MRSHPNHQLLLVDPDDDLRACRVLFLRMHGIRTVGAATADGTLQQLRAGFRPCVVVTDPHVAGDAAWPLVDYLRADSVLATVPLVLVTQDPVHVRLAHWHGVRECLPIPVAPQRYLAAIERHCRWRRNLPSADRAAAASPSSRRLEIASNADGARQPRSSRLRWLA